MNTGKVGLWTFAFDGQPAGAVRDAAAEIDELGFGALWFGEAGGREAFTQAAMLLAATSRIVVATGIARVFWREPAAAAHAQLTLAEAHPDRFLLGLGGKIASNQQRVPGFVERTGTPRPVEAMRGYLDAMDAAARKSAVRPENPPRRVLAALGPAMLRLAAERSWGAHPYFVTVDHTAQARKIMGPDAFIGVEQAVVLEPSRDLARQHIQPYVKIAQHHQNNLRRLGFGDDDLVDGGSDRLVDALVVGHTGGDPLPLIRQRIEDHLRAGADHVCLQVVTADQRIPLAEWRELAPILADVR
ncbi:TIGR03620 family F420-dependent LLM class oxidoreductase [Fodinicola acaciae]|uniref:TIGR03620 family F420-dependent LLM class oxidoreductase n=1 Tax=Fodinicola acaciae TaxID=2681555 RepID=UPI0013D23A6F|nr:TIGR03620 family F420-dependent LLM class oxidoreductase [Fodinicola acaciae]